MNKAFTLLELIIVIVVTGVISLAMLQTDFLSFQDTTFSDLEKDFRNLNYQLELSSLNNNANQSYSALQFYGNGMNLSGTNITDYNFNAPLNCNDVVEDQLNLNPNSTNYFCGTDINRFITNADGAEEPLNPNDKLVFFKKNGQKTDCILKLNEQQIMLARMELDKANLVVNAWSCKIDIITQS